MVTSARARQTRNILFGLTLALLASGMIAAPASAATTTSFRATFDEQATFVECPPGRPAGAICFVGSGVGTASPPGGAARESFFGYVDVAATDPKTGCTPDFTWTTISTREGSLSLAVQGMRCGTSPTDEGTWTVDSGTGLFDGARGRGKAVSLVTSQTPTGATSISAFEGRLVLAR